MAEAVINQALAEQIKSVAVTASVRAAEGDNLLSPAAVNTYTSQKDIREEAGKAIERDDLLAHLTSSENPLRSRALWSALIGTVGGLVVPWAARFGFNIDTADVENTQALIVDTIQAGSLLWAAYLAIRARYANAPLFANWFRGK
jgi:hypothetical protein